MSQLYFSGLIRVDELHGMPKVCENLSWCRVGQGVVQISDSSETRDFDMAHMCVIKKSGIDTKIELNSDKLRAAVGHKYRVIHVPELPTMTINQCGEVSASFDVWFESFDERMFNVTVRPQCWWVQLAEVDDHTVEICDQIHYGEAARKCKNVGEVLTAFAQANAYASVLDNYELLYVGYKPNGDVDERKLHVGGTLVSSANDQGVASGAENGFSEIAWLDKRGVRIERLIWGHDLGIWRLRDKSGDVVYSLVPELFQNVLLGPNDVKEHLSFREAVERANNFRAQNGQSQAFYDKLGDLLKATSQKVMDYNKHANRNA